MTSFLYILLAIELIASQSFHCDGSQRVPTGSGDVTGGVDDNVAAIKSVLLNVLGLTAEPVRGGDAGRRSRDAVPDFMWQLYRQQLTADEGRQLHQWSTDATLSDDARTDHSSRSLRLEMPPAYGGNTVRSFEAEEIAADSQANDQLFLDDFPSTSPDIATDSRTITSSASFRVLFNVSQALNDDVLYGAELRLCRHDVDVALRQRSSSPRRRYRISVYQVIKPSSPSEEPIRRLLDTRVVDTPLRSDPDEAVDHWVSLDVSPAVATWKQFGHRSNLGLDVETTTVDGRPIGFDRHIRVRRSTSNRNERPSPADRARAAGPGDRRPPNTGDPDPVARRKQPQLVTYADDRRIAARKRKRSAGGVRSKDRKALSNRPPSCRRRPLYVDFAEVEWNDWIVAPVGYQAYVCSGVCPLILPEHLNSTNHAQIQSLLHSVNRAVPAPCCVPTELSPISLLYFDETGTVVLRNYQDMVVEACGCR